MTKPASFFALADNGQLVPTGGEFFSDENTGAHTSPEEAVQPGREEKSKGEALHTLGMNFEYGIGVEKDEAKAIHCYRKAARKGSAKAQFTLGVKYEHGFGVVEDKPEAIRWYRKAAENDHLPAQFILGVKYQYGFGVKKDVKLAMQWYCKAAENGDAEALAKLKELCSDSHSAQIRKDIRIPASGQRIRKVTKRSDAQLRSPLFFLKPLAFICRLFF